MKNYLIEKTKRIRSSKYYITIALANFLLSLCFGKFAFSQSVNYYIDSNIGNDDNDGKSPSSPWQTLPKINSKSFQPGDSILFKSGGSWIGELKLNGSGNSSKPIILSNYGGSLKPLLNGNGLVGEAVVYLNNGEYWELINLEIINDASASGDRRGVLVSASNFGTVHHIYLRNLDIHNIKGIVGQDDNCKRTGGIGIETADDSRTNTRYDDLLIEGCNIYSCDNTGLYTDNLNNRSDYPGSDNWNYRCFTNVRIRNNVIHHIAKNAIILRLLDKGVVEYNLCYETALMTTGNTIYTIGCNGTICQYNEGYFNRSPDADGSLYDADLRSPNTVFQYSYSHDNKHGLFWACTVQNDSGVICRYNISQNDKGIIFCINYPSTSVYIYNNSVYIDSILSPYIISERNINAGTRNYFFYNNIVYNLSTTAKYDFRTKNYSRTFNYNVFFGKHPSNEPADLNKKISDPMFVNPGKAVNGLNTIDGYKLKPNSPCINSGLRLFNHCNFDLWGNPVPIKDIDRGAFQYTLPAGVKETGKIPEKGFNLLQNYPNPFNPVTNICFNLKTSLPVELKIFDLQGSTICTLKNGNELAGSYNVLWNGQNMDGKSVTSGIYFARLMTSEGTSSIKMMLLR